MTPLGVVRELNADIVWEVWEVRGASYSMRMGSLFPTTLNLPRPKESAATNIITKDKKNFRQVDALSKDIVSVRLIAT